MTTDAAEIWTRIQAELRREVTDTTYELWLAPLRPAGYEGDVVLVEAPGAIRGWVADRFAATLDRAAVAVLGPHARVELAGDGQPATP
ncbi:MAG: chromosomal replication initiator protein DnaA, partial [Solirubrobacterales bacterium]|nr:chromosomal replication initiator protein DnaA [Solirubrobacterales bacterium]